MKTLDTSPKPALKMAPLWWATGWGLVLFISYGTLAPSQYVPDLHLWDKLEHATAFFGMTCWFSGIVRRSRYSVLAVWMLIFGGAIEILQGVMGLGRDMDFWDWVADAVGIFFALVLVYLGLGRWTEIAERILGFGSVPE
jgi:VanZ family protein